MPRWHAANLPNDKFIAHLSACVPTDPCQLRPGCRAACVSPSPWPMSQLEDPPRRSRTNSSNQQHEGNDYVSAAAGGTIISVLLHIWPPKPSVGRVSLLSKWNIRMHMARVSKPVGACLMARNARVGEVARCYATAFPSPLFYLAPDRPSCWIKIAVRLLCC